VVAGGLFDATGRVLIAQRPPGSHMAGRWEFPGGKIDNGESELQALRRELTEELGIKLIAAELMLQLTHEYPERRVELSMWLVTAYEGEPLSLDGQALKWVKPAHLPHEDLLEADRPIVAALVELAAKDSLTSGSRQKIS
jgi:8-oxo-dGTP diphosphatase